MRFPNDAVGLPGLIAFAVGVVAFLVALFGARARSANGPESTDRQRDNRSILWIALQGIGIGIAGFGPLRITLDPLSAKALAEAAIVFALMVATVWLFDSASRTMGRNWALVARTREDGTLVQSGPFALVRNPIYVALGLFMLAMAIAYGHSRNLILAIPLFALGTWMRVVREEAVLRATFADYDAYAARVKRFLPGLF